MSKLWETGGIKTRAVVDFMLDHRGQVAKGSQIGLIKFPGSRLTMELIMKECLGVTDATFNDDVIIRMLDDLKILLKAEKTPFLYLVVTGIFMTKAMRTVSNSYSAGWLLII